MTLLQSLLEKITQAVGDTNPELASALKYRVTMKRVIARQLEMSERAIVFVQVRRDDYSSVYIIS